MEERMRNGEIKKKGKEDGGGEKDMKIKGVVDEKERRGQEEMKEEGD